MPNRKLLFFTEWCYCLILSHSVSESFRPQLSSDSRFNSAEELRRNMIHYDIKDFDSLPKETRDKDNGFSRNIPMMLKALRYFDLKQYSCEKGTDSGEDDKK